jgi:Protein of unknown function (DUF998)
MTTVLAGVARCSDRSCPVRVLGDANATLSDDVHGASSMATFVLWGAMPLVAASRGRRMRSAYRGASAVLGVVTAAAWLGTGVLVRRRAARWTGVGQRVMVCAALSWFPVAALAASDDV